MRVIDLLRSMGNYASNILDDDRLSATEVEGFRWGAEPRGLVAGTEEGLIIGAFYGQDQSPLVYLFLDMEPLQFYINSSIALLGKPAQDLGELKPCVMRLVSPNTPVKRPRDQGWVNRPVHPRPQ